MIRHKKAQESGTLQNILISLVLVVSVSYFLVGYLQGISSNYDIPMNESQYAVFQQYDEVNATIGSLTGQFISDDGEQIEDTDVISAMITGAYGIIKLVFNIPDLFFTLISGGIAALGVPPQQAAVLGGMAVTILIVMILFAAVALIMKVRA